MPDFNPGFIPDKIIKDAFSFDTGITGWTVELYKDGNTSGISVTVTEIGSTGIYTVSFTPDSNALWFVKVFETATPTNEFSFSYHVYDPGEEVLFSGSATSTVSNELGIIRDTTLTADNFEWAGRKMKVTTGTNAGHEAIVLAVNGEYLHFTPRLEDGGITSGDDYEVYYETAPVNPDVVYRGETTASLTATSRALRDSNLANTQGGDLEGMVVEALTPGETGSQARIDSVDTSTGRANLSNFMDNLDETGELYQIVKSARPPNPAVMFYGRVTSERTPNTVGFFCTDLSTPFPTNFELNYHIAVNLTEWQAGWISSYISSNGSVTVVNDGSNPWSENDTIAILAVKRWQWTEWDEPVANHNVSGSFGELVQKIMTWKDYIALNLKH